MARAHQDILCCLLEGVFRFMSIELMMLSNHLILCLPLLLLPLVFPSIRVFSSESALCIRCPKYWSFSFSISPSNKYSGSISFRIDWFALLAVQETLKSLLQHYSLKTSIYWCSAFSRGFPMAQIVKSLPAMQETQVRSLGREDPLEKGIATHSGIPIWRFRWTKEPGGLTVLGVAESWT